MRVPKVTLSRAGWALGCVAAFLAGRVSSDLSTPESPPTTIAVVAPAPSVAMDVTATTKLRKRTQQAGSSSNRSEPEVEAAEITGSQVMRWLSENAYGLPPSYMALIVDSWSLKDASAAEAWLNDSGNNAYKALAGAITEGDREWLDANKGSPLHDFYVLGFLSKATRHGDLNFTGTLSWIETLEDPTRKAEAWSDAGYKFLLKEPELIDELLASSDLPSLQKDQVRSNWGKKLTAHSQRNAQNIVSVYGAALAAGATFDDTSSPEAIISQLIQGVNGSGTFLDSEFKISGGQDVYDAAEFIELSGSGTLTYDPN